MVIYFNKTDLVEFGLYLLSEDREKRWRAVHDPNDNVPVDDRLRQVYHADVENFLELQRKKKEGKKFPK